MGNIRKINGHDIKDELVRNKLNAMIEDIERFSEELIEVQNDIEVIETFIGAGDSSDIYDQVMTNTRNIQELKELIESGTIVPGGGNVQPKVTLSISPSYIQHNTSAQINITPTFTQGSAGAFVKYEIYKNNVLYLTRLNTSSVVDTVSLSHNAKVTYKCIVYYDKSNNMDAGSVSATQVLSAYAPCYYGVIDGDFNESMMSQLTAKLSSGRANTLSFSLASQKSVYAYPTSFGELVTIRDDNNFNYINSYEVHNVTYQGVSYFVYVLIDPVTINKFTQIFN